MQISVLGGGSWGTAISKELAKKFDVIMYVRNEETRDNINTKHRNNRYLKDYDLPVNIKATSDINEVLNNKYIINTIPTQVIRKVLSKFSDKFNKNSVIINLSKGIEEITNLRISEIYKEFLPNNDFVALSGPSHAEEVIIGAPTSLVAASTNFEVAKEIQSLFMSPTLRIYTNEDLLGVELGGAVKNVLALGIGMLDGFEFGDNPKAAMMTRGIHEMTRFCVAMGGKRTTLYGLTGLGDLIVTATSKHSRNRKAGELIGRGYTVNTLEKEIGMVVEGITTCRALYDLSKLNNIYMPITTVIYKILYENMNIETAKTELMTSPEKKEFDF